MRKGFTLVETMVAISLLMIAIVPPMLLTVQSLSAAYYSRDQITAFYLAQEGLEEVHQIRDGQILLIAESSDASGIDIFGSLASYDNSQPFIIDATDNSISACAGGASPTYGCPPLKTDGTLYGYQPGWVDTNFTRVLQACYVQSNGDCSGNETDEMRVQVTVSWHTGSYSTRSFTISEDLYRWVQDGSAT